MSIKTTKILSVVLVVVGGLLLLFGFLWNILSHQDVVSTDKVAILCFAGASLFAGLGGFLASLVKKKKAKDNSDKK